MKKFSKKRKCEKCGTMGASSLYCNDLKFPKICFNRRTDIQSEHIHRTCTECKYEWIESTLAEPLDIKKVEHLNLVSRSVS